MAMQRRSPSSPNTVLPLERGLRLNLHLHDSYCDLHSVESTESVQTDGINSVRWSFIESPALIKLYSAHTTMLIEFCLHARVTRHCSPDRARTLRLPRAVVVPFNYGDL